MATYTPTMIAAMEAAQPLNLEKAKDLASDLNVSYRSVIAKAKQLGLEYQNAQPAAKRPKGVTKASLVADISEAIGESVDSLAKANMADLQILASFFDNDE